MVAGMAALVVVDSGWSSSPARGVAIVVRDQHDGLSRLAEQRVPDVIVGSFQFQVKTARPLGEDTNDYVNDLDTVLLLNGYGVFGSYRDPLPQNVARLDGVNRMAMLGGSKDSSGFYGESGGGWLPPEALSITFSQLYPPLRDMLRTYDFAGLNLFPYRVSRPVFDY